MSFQPKKMLILDILEILNKYTDESHSLTQKEISDILIRDYDMKADRKSVKRNLMDLIEAGFDIEYKEIKLGVGNVSDETPDSDGASGSETSQYTDFHMLHKFSDAELHLLIDGILFSKNIPVKQRKDLIEKLESLSSIYFRSNAKNILTMQNKTGAGAELFYNIDIINEAMEKNKRVDFNYLAYGTDKHLHKRITRNGKIRRFSISPYSIAASNGRYYVICNNDWYGSKVSHYRIDRITNIKIVDTPRRPMSEIEGLKQGFSLSRHVGEHVFMYTDEAKRITFRMKKDLLSELFDWFDPDDIRFSDETEDAISVTLTCSPDSMRLWAKQFSSEVTVLSPPVLAEQIKEDLRQAYERYCEATK